MRRTGTPLGLAGGLLVAVCRRRPDFRLECSSLRIAFRLSAYSLAACSLSLAQSAWAGDPHPPAGTPDPSIATSLPPTLADPAGIRSSLAARGVEFGLNYIGEVWGNTRGGIERGTVYDGRLEFYVDIDLAKAHGWRGLSFHAHGYQIHGEGITATKVGNLNALSNIEATATTRLLDIWLQQKLFDDRLSIRVGQMAVDSEFILSANAAQFISASFGWPTITASNLPNGGSAYPFSAPGVRIEYSLTDQTRWRAGVFNDDPVGPCDGDPQLCNPYGLEFRLGDPPFVISEFEFKYNRDAGSGLPGTLKLGGWFDFGHFDDQRFDTTGLSLANPTSLGTPKKHDGDQGFYAILDQQLFAGAMGKETVSMFARVMGSPGDRNLVDFYIDGGLIFGGFVPGRPNDSFGVAAALARISDRASDLDRDAVSFGTDVPIRDDEALIEINYIAEIVPGWTFQPDFQYVWRPGGNVPDASGARPIGDAAVVGARTTINY